MDLDAARRFRERILDARAALVAEGDATVALEEAGPVPSKIDEDEAPYREMGQVLASNRNRERAVKLRAMEEALGRLASDPEAFGVCEQCGEDIAEGRLVVVPWARTCVACANERERDAQRHTRRKVTDYRG